MLAAFKTTLVVPLVVSSTTAVVAVQSFEQLSPRVRNLNAAVAALKSLRIWWQSLSMVEKRMPTNKNHLISVTEGTVDVEVSAWMKSTTSSRRKPDGEQAEEGEKDEKDAGKVEKS